MQERRAAPRIKMRHKVGVLLSSGDVVYAWTYDLSLTGIQFLSEYSADVGDTLRLFMSVLDPKVDEYVAIYFNISVIHVVYDGAENCFRIGVDFAGFDGDGKEIYERFLDGRIYSRFGQHLLER